MGHSGNIELAANEILALLGEEQTSTADPTAQETTASIFGGWAAATKSTGSDAGASCSLDEQGLPELASQQGYASGMQLSQCYMAGEEQLPECIICGRSSKRGGASPQPH